MTSWRALFSTYLRRKRFWGALAGMAIILGVSIYALYGLVRGSEHGLTFAELHQHLTLGLLLKSSLAYAADLALAITVWILIIGSLSDVWTWREHARIYCINAVVRRLPGSMWYLLGRVVMYEKLGIPRSITLIASGIEYVVTLLGGLLVALLAWPIVLSNSSIDPLWLIAGLLLGGLLLNPPMLRAIIKRVSPQTHALNLRYRHLLGWTLCYALVWCGGGVILFVLADTLHPLPLSTLPAMIGIWATSALLPQLLTFLPFGLGVQEITLSALLAPFIGGTEAIVVALLLRVIATINEVLWACIASLIRLPRHEQSSKETRFEAPSSRDSEMTLLSSRQLREQKLISLSDAENPNGVPQSPQVIPPK
jgi:hypothetical protein